MASYTKTYNISAGSVDIIQRTIPIKDEIVSLQVDTDGTFNGTTATVQLVQSNDIDLALALWHPLPEPALTLAASDSSLLSTTSFTAKFIALRITAGDATAGILTMNENFKD